MALDGKSIAPMDYVTLDTKMLPCHLIPYHLELENCWWRLTLKYHLHIVLVLGHVDNRFIKTCMHVGL